MTYQGKHHCLTVMGVELGSIEARSVFKNELHNKHKLKLNLHCPFFRVCLGQLVLRKKDIGSIETELQLSCKNEIKVSVITRYTLKINFICPKNYTQTGPFTVLQ